MPNYTPDGKRLGGAAQTRKKQQTRREELQRQEQREPQIPTRQPLSYSSIEPPNLDDTASLIRYGARVLAVVMDQTMMDGAITEEQRRRELRDAAAKLGMIRDKASEQEKIDKVDSAVTGQKKGAAKSAGKSLAGVSKPETARRTPSASGA